MLILCHTIWRAISAPVRHARRMRRVGAVRPRASHATAAAALVGTVTCALVGTGAIVWSAGAPGQFGGETRAFEGGVLPVPEPGSAMLLGVGVAGILFVSLRRKVKHNGR